MIPLKKELYDLRKVIDNSLLNLDYLITAKELKIEKDIPKCPMVFNSSQTLGMIPTFPYKFS